MCMIGYEAGMNKNKLRIIDYNFTSKKINRPLRIVYFADLHNCRYGVDNTDLIRRIQGLNPDYILLAGDMVVGHPHQESENLKTAHMIITLSEIAPVYYAVGNHEKGILDCVCGMEDGFRDSFLSVLETSENVKLLRNHHEFLEADNIDIYGLDLERAYYQRVIQKPLSNEHMLACLKTPDKERFNILLAHNPDYFESYAGWQADLVLSGHNHGGMIRLPMLGGLVSPRLRIFPKYDYGLYHKDKTDMILTGGAGSHSHNFRLNNPPEIVMIQLHPYDHKAK